ncbi:hypothetical protein Aph01nite_14390 [Acrocarpospora phusangensis]|uniref:Uncharacterized protein n=1 Tax=Acrocarpospora phusangensis TaxID=1070424 RepID=A0A919Q658_9ACTN|nr:hypothetical protein [Acrocarpospora phusangensis]GIH23129.1 hypothetical protein Aph01nite_14390 [Acrocarpospora phusangensis]
MPGSGILDNDVLTFPPVELALDDELAAIVLAVPLVRDAHRLAAWTGTREVTEASMLTEADAAAAAGALGLTPARLGLLWVVAVNGRLIEITKAGARPGPGCADPMEFWDGVVMDVLDRTDTPDGLTGSAVIDEHLTEILATMYSVRDGMAFTALASGILQAHEVGCEARPAELRRLRVSLPAELAEAMDLLRYCGLIEVVGDLVRLTPPGVWAVRRDLLREGHDAPSLSEVAGLAELSAGELVDAMLAGRASASAATLWLERRVPEEAARDLIKIAASGNAAQRGTAGTILEELGPEAAPAVREALDEPMMWRYAAAWLGVRDLEAPALGGGDGAWVAVDTLAALLYLNTRVDSPAKLDILGEDLLSLVPEMGAADHPDTLAVLELLGKHHPDVVVAKAARKTAMKARSR